MAKRHPKMTPEESLREHRARGHFPSDGSVSYPSSRRRRPDTRPAERLNIGAAFRRYEFDALSSDDAGAVAGILFIGSACLGAARIYFNIVGSLF
ncbi:hypothetical protein [Clavibacter michiganensis]|uniref:hypothetical protein n=1 Tax=Clavibacter michiganensis TaxID=28447 RepID=UPI002930C9B7|nr:hypothetical protein [Clavibacter michiganensis]